MKNLTDFLSHNKHFFILILFIPLQIWFAHLELTVIPKYITDAALDKQIPFIKEFVIAYILLFPYIAYGIIYTGLHCREDFYRLIIFLLGTMSVSCAVYALFPNGQNLRPIIKQQDPFSMMIRYIYATDTSTDVCPSMHVIDAIAVNAALQDSEVFAAKRFGKPASTVVMITMCLSTVFIKQHSIVDVFWGMITAAFFYIPLYLLPKLKIYNKFRKNYEPLADAHGKNIGVIPKIIESESVDCSDKTYEKAGKSPKT